MSSLSPKKDNKIKTPLIQTKITKNSPLATTRTDNMGLKKGPSNFLRQSLSSKKSTTQQGGIKEKVQNTSIKQLQQRLGGIETKLANIKASPDKKASPVHNAKEFPKQQTKNNSSEAGKKKVQTSMSPNSIYKKDAIRKSCSNIVKAFQTSKMLLNPSQMLSTRITFDEIEPLKINKAKSLADSYQMVSLQNNSRKSFKANLQIKTPDNKKILKSNVHSGNNLNQVQKKQSKMRVTISNNLFPKGNLQKSPIKTLFDSSSSENKAIQQSSQSMPQLDLAMTLSMIKDKKKAKQNITISHITTHTIHHINNNYTPKEELVTSRNRVNSLLVRQYKPIEETIIKITDFQKIKSLGQGKFSKVFLAVHKKFGFLVAIKQISKEKIKKLSMVKQVTDEIKLHSTLNHPNIVKFYSLLEDLDNLYLILEYVQGGSLFDFLAQNQRINVKMTLHYLRDIIAAIQYLHEKSIAHRDIKPQNILIGMNCIAKVCDLGWSAVILTSQKTYCGTFDYLPPQILLKKDYDLSVDVWCLGVLTYQLLVGKVPYEGDKHTVAMNKIHNAEITFPEQSQEFPIQAKNYIQWLVQHNPQERPKSKQLLQHKFFQPTKQQIPQTKQ